MKVSYQYRKYEGCDEATRLSDLGGRMSVVALPTALLLGVLTDKVLGTFLVGLIIGLVICIGLGVYFNRKAAKTAAVFYIEKQLGRSLSEDEKRKLLEKNGQ